MRGFFTWVSERRSIVLYLLVVGIVCMIYFILQKLHYREGVSNLQVYYGAGKAALEGSILYRYSFDGGVGYFESAPIVAYLFSPLTLTNYAVANGFYYFFILTIFIFLTPYLLYRLDKDYALKPLRVGWVLVLCTLFLIDHLERELHLGNFNIFLLVISLFIYRFLSLNKVFIAGLLMALIFLMKPSLIILVPLFFLFGKWRFVITWSVGVALGLSVPLLFGNHQLEYSRLLQWVEIWIENPLVYQSPNTLYGIYNQWILNPFGYESGLFIVPAVLLLVGFFFYRWYQRIKVIFPEMHSILGLAVGLALVPNLIHADTEHFMWSWLLLILLFIALQQLKKAKGQVRLYSCILTLAFIPYVLNSPDIVGRRLMLIFDEGGWLGFAHFIIIVTFMWILVSERNTPFIQPQHID